MDTTFVNGSTLSDADWFNDLNRLHYTILADPADVAAVKATLHAAPGAIGGTTPAAGSFTTVAASSTILTSAAAISGYTTGAGGAVTQGTSRTTAVTLNKPCGTITMFSDAGSATVSAFQVNNSLIAATDVVILSARDSTNTYLVYPTLVAAGSFYIAFQTTGGTATDAPLINFAIIKSVTS